MKHLFKTYAPACTSALLLSWAFPTFHLHWLAWVALTPLFRRAARLTPRQAAAYFLLCGHLFHTLTLQWLVANIFWAGGWAIIGQQLLCLILSCYWALLGWLWRSAHQKSPAYGGACCLAGLWLGMELLQARLFTGFGWCAIGYSQGANLWFAQWAAVGGVSLLSGFVVLVNALLALATTEAPRRFLRLAAAAVLAIGLHVAGWLMFEDAVYTDPPFRAGVIQANIPQEMKWDADYDLEILQRTAFLTRSLAASKPMDIAVWPEAMIVRHFETDQFLEILSSTARDAQIYIFTGTVRNEYATGKSFNSSVLVTPEGAIDGYYDKIHLAPFGEYVPLESWFPFLSKIAFGGVDAGEEQRVFSFRGRTMGPIICFEVLFAPMAERLRDMGADVLAVITNLAWFGSSSAIPQELEIARLRAIETRLPLIHSANTGISGVFDPYGRFQVVRRTVTPEGLLMDWGDRVRPRQVMTQRFVDTFPVAEPGRRLVPFGPVAAPWGVAAAGVVLLLFAWGSRIPWPDEMTAPKESPATRRKKKKTDADIAAPGNPRKKSAD